MNITSCIYGPNRSETVVAYLYDELEPSERAGFVAHIAACAVCGSELAELRDVRQQLAQWAPPEDVSETSSLSRSEGKPAAASFWTMARDVPAWAQVAAAVLFLGVAAGIANVELRYDSGGLSVRTGWNTRTEVASSPGPSQADLAALEARLQKELQSARTASASPSAGTGARMAAVETSDAEIVRRVRALIADSERNQQRELALRVAEVMRDVQAQRVSDLQRIDRSLGIIQSSTGVEVMRQRQLLNNLAVRVSQQQ